MKIVIVDQIGLCYDGNTLEKRGLGGSESAVILISKELVKLGFEVTVFNNCIDSQSSPGVYDGVRYIDNSMALQHNESYDIAIVSRTVSPFVNGTHPFVPSSKKKILWLHDTFIQGDEHVERLTLNGTIDHIFTLSDWHTSYILNATHGARRNYEVLKKFIFQTRNGAVRYIDKVDLSKKDKNHFVYNASATKGMVPLLEDIWPEIKRHIPEARLTIIGGYYRFREGHPPDAQEETVMRLAEKHKDSVTFTGVISQKEIADILANAYMMLYPAAFPETFGISTLESLLYNTPLVTNCFGALEETAVNLACYQMNYPIEPNVLFPHIDKKEQVKKYIQLVLQAYNDTYLHQQKQNYCDVVKDVAGWDTVALQWKQFFYKITDNVLPVEDFRKVDRVNDKVARVFGRTSSMPAAETYKCYGPENKILIISPFWNAENYIEKNIRSVASQDYNNYIHVLIDDNSNDNSYSIAHKTIQSLPKKLRSRFILKRNEENKGAIRNQLETIRSHQSDIVVLLDGDDWLVNNNTIFKLYSDLYDNGYDFTYGSMWSVVDNIPLIAQDYPEEVKKNKSYRQHQFNWGIPYTHLRTFAHHLAKDLNDEAFKYEGEWMKAGADNPLFYELIERSQNPVAIKEIVCNYNDANLLNDYKIRGEEQNRNAKMAWFIPYHEAKTKEPEKKEKTILIAIPTEKYIEPATFKSIYDLEVPAGYKTDFQFFFGYQVDQIRNLIADWGKRYDYLLSVDSDIVLPSNALKKMLAADKDVISGLYIQRIPNSHVLEVYNYNDKGGMSNIQIEELQGKGVTEIGGCGMGCVLIKGEVFRKMEYPHFVYKSHLDHSYTISEDVYFCHTARQKGFTIWVDPSIKCSHIGKTTFNVI